MNLEPKVFLFSDGSILAKAGTVDKIDPTFAERFRQMLRDKSVKMYVCEEAAQKRAISKENLEPGISMVGYATFLGMAIEAKTVITV
jgi:predicted peroxiredoxin